MLKKALIIGAALMLGTAVAALAETPESLPQVTPDQALEQAQSRLFAAQSDFYAAAARKLQADLAASRKAAADTAAWWHAWWQGVYPPAKAK